MDSSSAAPVTNWAGAPAGVIGPRRSAEPDAGLRPGVHRTALRSGRAAAKALIHHSIAGQPISTARGGRPCLGRGGRTVGVRAPRPVARHARQPRRGRHRDRTAATQPAGRGADGPGGASVAPPPNDERSRHPAEAHPAARRHRAPAESPVTLNAMRIALAQILAGTDPPQPGTGRRLHPAGCRRRRATGGLPRRPCAGSGSCCPRSPNP